MDNIYHEEFTYLLIPYDINVNVKELKFNGLEKDFRNILTKHFSIHTLLPDEIQKLHKQYTKETNGQHSELISDCIASSNTYQIIPLTLPAATNGYKGINCYIDNVGRIKNLPTNARATRVCSTDIRGDCFISLTFDNDDEFKRLNFSTSDYENLLNNPPDPTGRWDYSKLNNILNNTNKTIEKAEPKKPELYCENCRKEFRKNDKYFNCGKCKKVKYCGPDCQRSDWVFHKNICK